MVRLSWLMARFPEGGLHPGATLHFSYATKRAFRTNNLKNIGAISRIHVVEKECARLSWFSVVVEQPLWKVRPSCPQCVQKNFACVALAPTFPPSSGGVKLCRAVTSHSPARIRPGEGLRVGDGSCSSSRSFACGRSDPSGHRVEKLGLHGVSPSGSGGRRPQASGAEGSRFCGGPAPLSNRTRRIRDGDKHGSLTMSIVFDFYSAWDRP